MSDHPGDDWIFEDYPTLIPAHGEYDAQIARWRENAERDEYETQDRGNNVAALIANSGRKRQSVVWRWLQAFGRAS